MKEILIITNYYPPEIGAASNRIFQLARGLKRHNYMVSVVTPLPNYPHGKVFKDYKSKGTVNENGIEVKRLWLLASNSKNKIKRLIAMLSYSFSLVRFFVFNKIPDKVIVQSPPLLVAFTSILFLRSKKRKIILNVSDLWPLAGFELGAFNKGFGYSLLKKIEAFNYRNADLILGQSEEILTHVSSIVPEKNKLLYRNFPNLKPSDINANYQVETKIKLCYAGLLGVAQGVLELCYHLDFTRIEFHIFGEGAERNLIEQFIAEHPELPITFHGEVSRNDLHKKILNYDVAIIPLVKRIYGSVPSKIFEFANLGMPILYFGGGEGETIVNENQLGWVVEVGNYSLLNKTLDKIKPSEINASLRKTIQATSVKNFNFDKQLAKLVKSI